MKKLVIAVGLLAVGATTASAQYAAGRPSYDPRPSATWRRDAFPYEQRHHSLCQEKAWRLRWYERRAGADGRFSWSERRELAALRRDLDRTCNRFRWNG